MLTQMVFVSSRHQHKFSDAEREIVLFLISFRNVFLLTHKHGGIIKHTAHKPVVANQRNIVTSDVSFMSNLNELDFPEIIFLRVYSQIFNQSPFNLHHLAKQSSKQI